MSDFNYVSYSPLFRRRLGSRVVKVACQLSIIFIIALVFLALLTATFRPSYTNPPQHYQDLDLLASESDDAGRVNPQNEKIFIAATLYDPSGRVVGGSWGQEVLKLIHLLGPQNTFLSIYESDSGSGGAAALEDFKQHVPCGHSLISEPTVPLDHPSVVTLDDGEPAVKRIAYLATARNRALDPLTVRGSPKYDKILYLNDVIFDPVEAAQLLLSTNRQQGGETKYRAACAVDFKYPFLFYDTFATRDFEGWSMGLPLYPWFSGSGEAQSRQDVLQQKDAVRVKSCWGGMIAFDAKYFQPEPSLLDGLKTSHLKPEALRFRAVPDLYWEASECCLVNADLAALGAAESPNQQDQGIYMNPYVRTAYADSTFRWLNSARRVEKMLAPFQMFINVMANLPHQNTRRTTRPDETVWKTVWKKSYNNGTGSWERKRLPAGPGGFCGVRNLLVRRIDPKDGQEINWVTIPLPKDMLQKEREFEEKNPA